MVTFDSLCIFLYRHKRLTEILCFIVCLPAMVLKSIPHFIVSAVIDGIFAMIYFRGKKLVNSEKQ